MHSGNHVGRLKLGFNMSKGQFEVEVISAEGLKIERDSSLGKFGTYTSDTCSGLGYSFEPSQQNTKPSQSTPNQSFKRRFAIYQT